MFKSIAGSPITTTIAAIAVAASIAGFVVLLTSVAPEAEAKSSVTAEVQQHVKGDRLAVRISGSACSKHSWPDYEQGCQFDLRGPARTVRIIALR